MAKANVTRRKLAQLLSLMEGTSTMLIVLQDNPDPDAIASAAALRHLANTRSDMQCTIAHGGIVGRAENLALLRYLNLRLHPLRRIRPNRYDLIAMVDAQPGTGNTSLPLSHLPDIVIDHHPIRQLTRRALFTDIRSRYGATSTILCEYLREAWIPPPHKLATALVYGIRSDTQDLGRETLQADIEAYLSLYPLANHRALSRIETGRVPPAYFAMLAHALRNARSGGQSLVTHIGQIQNPDMIAEVADLLLRCEGMNWVLCQGVFRNRILFSIRTLDPQANAGRIAHRVAGSRGTGGGHAVLAAGQIPLAGRSPAGIKTLQDQVTRRFLRATTPRENNAIRPLIPG